MKMRNTSGSAAAAAIAALIYAVACADPTATHNLVVGDPSLVLVGDATGSTVGPEVLRVCKVWVNTAVADITATLNGAGAGDITNPFTIPAATGTGGNTCRAVAIHSAVDPHSYTVTETDPGLNFTTTWTIDSNDNALDANGSGLTTGSVTVGGTVGDVPLGTPRGAVVTFTNTFTPPATGCTFTKGYYRNHPTAVSTIIAGLGGTITVGGQALTAAQAQAILNATPGQPGSITFQNNNLLLNATQQLITAILNGGASGPSSVQAAITTANAHIVIVYPAISVTPAGYALSGLVTTLTNFNEGTFTGFPHCAG